MDNTEFTNLAEAALQEIYDLIEAADSDYLLEVDLLDGILTIELPDGGQYIINKHNASQQVWLSSPVSGASHFSYAGGKWVDSRGNEFFAVVKGEIGRVVDI